MEQYNETLSDSSFALDVMSSSEGPGWVILFLLVFIFVFDGWILIAAITILFYKVLVEYPCSILLDAFFRPTKKNIIRNLIINPVITVICYVWQLICSRLPSNGTTDKNNSPKRYITNRDFFSAFFILYFLCLLVIGIVKMF